jgi:pimeloyl-ACP methyl ester carboxylesterase
VHARIGKQQIAYLARHCRVLTFDGRGSGRSDRPSDPAAYAAGEFATDAFAVMDAVGVERAHLVALSAGARRALVMAAERPERVAGRVAVCPSVPLGDPPPGRHVSFDAVRDAYEGWDLYDWHAWRHDCRRFLEFFFSTLFTEPHSTKPIEDVVVWGLETDGETLIATQLAPAEGADEVRALRAGVRCPVLVIQGSDDAVNRLRCSRGSGGTGARLRRGAGGAASRVGRAHVSRKADCGRCDVDERSHAS